MPDRPLSHTQLEQRLHAIAHASGWMMAALRAVRALGLESWCIGAGAVRTLVWDSLHGYATASVLPDIDVAYFDASDLTAARDSRLQCALARQCPGLPWEVTNQAGVHLWYEEKFGIAVAPLSSLAQALSTWPEYATAVGLCLDAGDAIHVIAPHGLDDLFALRVRHNPVRASRAAYRQRVAEKRYAERWPLVQVVDL